MLRYLPTNLVHLIETQPNQWVTGIWGRESDSCCAVSDHGAPVHILPPPALEKKNASNTAKMVRFSTFTNSGIVDFQEIVRDIYDEVNEKYETDYKIRQHRPGMERTKGETGWSFALHGAASSPTR